MLSATAPVRIPAWQRLGLKLKSAQASEPTSASPAIECPKRKNDDSIEDLPPKRAKKDHSLAPTIGEHITPSRARKKSVSFTPETKIEDGDSIKQLFSAWVADQKSQDPSFLPKSQVFDTPEPSRVEEYVDSTLDEKERMVKRTKTSEDHHNQSKKPTKSRTPKSSKPSKITKVTTAPTRPFLEYLKQYHDSRGTWKFNKNHQNHLLKNIFSVDVISSDHSHLIYEYVQGLQGSVRTRLRDTAVSIKVKDKEDGAAGFPESMAERDKKQREYDEALNEYVATMTASNASKKMGYEEGVLLGLSDAAMAPRVAKRLRAEEILAELAATGEIKEEEPAKIGGPKMTYDVDDSDKRLRMNDGSSQKVVRKRKQRTTAADDDTSSSGESTDSGSSSDEDSATPPRRHARVESSSSSSSSSSSDSSDSSDSNEDSDEEESDESESD